MSSDGGAKSLSHFDAKSQHVDWAVLDWAEGKLRLALEHEANGLLLASHDGGKSFAEVGWKGLRSGVGIQRSDGRRRRRRG